MVSLFGPARRYNKTEIVTKKASILTYEEWNRKASFEQYFFFTWDNEIQERYYCSTSSTAFLFNYKIIPFSNNILL